MAITDLSQLIDYKTIQFGCNQYKDAVEDFYRCGEKVIQAGESCDKKTLSVEDGTLEYQIKELGKEIQNLKNTLARSAAQVERDAIIAYNHQVEEYNTYVRQNTNNN